MTITDIPHMGAQKIGDRLRYYAESVPKGSVIAELGVWLGSGTAYLAEGARESGSHVYAYDRFNANGSEIVKAREQGWTIKGDTLPAVRKAITDLGLSQYVTFRKGDICSERWTHGKIGLFVLDTCKRKRAFLKVVKMYSRYWIPGQTVVVLMDYWFFKYCKPFIKHNKDACLYRYQYEWMEKNKHAFRDLEPDMAAPSSAAFLYLGGL